MPSTNAAAAPSNSTWGTIPASDVSCRTFNPIRDVISRPMKPLSTPKSTKEQISLSIGDPTVFGNFKTHPVVVESVEKAVRSFNYNGYPPSVGCRFDERMLRRS
ncbi:hypothetical protein GGI23_004686 [Coemansia sp. RSA 2559]|nr:hypothetical protein GGI23_004686 [Coemansia sp. RSA 2559]